MPDESASVEVDAVSELFMRGLGKLAWDELKLWKGESTPDIEFAV